MSAELQILLLTAITIACLHTLSGPDHYLPFIALSRARGWSAGRTALWTVVCGCGHVWSSVLLGLGGAALGWSLHSIKWLEGVRGGVAGWALLLFGFAYMIWGAVRSRQNKLHKHFDVYDDAVYVYEHRHGAAITPAERHPVTPWVLFLIFVLGPCEPMIPLLFFPAATRSTYNMVVMILVYTIFTLLTMLLMTALGFYGVRFLKTEWLERNMHALSGLALLICGAGMVFLNW